MSENKKYLTFAILEFLQKSCQDGTIKNEDIEGIEVAMQCIGEAFAINIDDAEQQKKYSPKPASLATIFDVYLNTQKKRQQAGSSSLAQSTTAAEAPKSATEVLSADEKEKAEKLKAAGNLKVTEKNYPEAIKLYTQAIAINNSNAVYYANRAAAYSQQGDHHQAVEDSLKAAEIDSNYSKAYSRLGHAYFSLGQYNDAIEAYEKGLKIDPKNAAMKSALAAAQGKVTEQDDVELKGGASGGAGARGIPGSSGLGGFGGANLSTMLNNPAIMEIAHQMAQSGALDSLMSNPNITQMAQNFASSGNLPDMSTIEEMMRTPEIANMVRGLGDQNGAGGMGGNGKEDNALEEAP